MLLYFVLSAACLGIVFLILTPVSLRFDSRERSLHVRWMGLSVTKRLAKKRPKPAKEKGERKKRRSFKVPIRLLFKERTLIYEVVQKTFRSILNMLKTVSIHDLEGSFSTPDPALNGMLWGIFSSLQLENVRLSANFQNVNYIRGSLRFYPYKVTRVAATFLIRIPYRPIIRTVLAIRKHR